MADRTRAGHPPACERLRPNIVSDLFFDNDTFSECRLCGTSWQTRREPGLLHRYVVCSLCAARLERADAYQPTAV